MPTRKDQSYCSLCRHYLEPERACEILREKLGFDCFVLRNEHQNERDAVTELRGYALERRIGNARKRQGQPPWR